MIAAAGVAAAADVWRTGLGLLLSAQASRLLLSFSFLFSLGGRFLLRLRL